MVRFLLEKGKGIKVVDMGEEWEGAVTYRSPGKCNQDIVDFVLKQGANLSLTDSHNPWAWRRVYWRPKGRNDDSDSDTDEYLIADPPHIPLRGRGFTGLPFTDTRRCSNYFSRRGQRLITRTFC